MHLVYEAFTPPLGYGYNLFTILQYCNRYWSNYEKNKFALHI